MEVAILPIDSHAVKGEDVDYGIGFAHEPMPEQFARRSQESLRHFWGFAKFELPLPELVESALDKGVKSLESALPPFMWVSKRGHGDIGSVFLIKDIKEEELYHKGEGTGGKKWNEYLSGKNDNVVARVSFGSGTDVTEWKPDQFERLHIGAYGIRRFYPADRDSDALNSELYVNGACLAEEVYLSLRWLKREGTWGFDNPYGDFCETLGTRLSWMRARKGEFCHNVARCTSHNLISSAPELDDFGQPRERTEPTIAERMNNLETTHSGYKAVLGLLGGFGNVNPEDDVASMTPEQGVDYLFERVVPAIKNFTNY